MNVRNQIPEALRQNSIKNIKKNLEFGTQASTSTRPIN